MSHVLQKHNVKGAIFISGKIAINYPECINSFDDDVDIGSQTYNFVDLKSIPDYSIQLDEVRDGKYAVDSTGNLISKLFRAPYGNTDDNIYSLLYRSEILADFSYENQYNKYYNENFLKFEISNFNSSKFSENVFYDLVDNGEPIVVNFNNSIPVENIENFISHMGSHNVRFVSASELTNMQLTIRNGGMS